MKVLVVSDDSGDTSSFLLSLMSTHQCKIHSLMSDQIVALVGKYEDIKHIPAAETHTILYEAAKQVLATLDTFDPDVVVGIGMGANVLTYLISYKEWRGASVIVDPMPIQKGSAKILYGDEAKQDALHPCVWIVKNSFFQDSGNHVKKISYLKNAVMTVSSADEKFKDVCSGKTILAAIDAVT